MWICLRVAKNITRKGKIHRYQPGEWVEVGRQIAEQWIAAREAFGTDEIVTELPIDTAGMVIRQREALQHAKASQVVQKLGLDSHISENWAYLRYAEMLVWEPTANLRPDLVGAGFSLLKKWHIAIPLCDDGVLASNTGPEADQQKTLDLIGDNRIPLRDTRLIFVRRCDVTRALWVDMHDEIESGADERHAFLRALWKHQPVICDLPNTWI